jgi:hypothetical protein
MVHGETDSGAELAPRRLVFFAADYFASLITRTENRYLCDAGVTISGCLTSVAPVAQLDRVCLLNRTSNLASFGQERNHPVPAMHFQC